MQSLPGPAKILLIVGAVLIAVGLLWALFPGVFRSLGKLPGDIAVERENARFYFPITTSILLSVVFSLVLWIIHQLKK